MMNDSRDIMRMGTRYCSDNQRGEKNVSVTKRVRVRDGVERARLKWWKERRGRGVAGVAVRIVWLVRLLGRCTPGVWGSSSLPAEILRRTRLCKRLSSLRFETAINSSNIPFLFSRQLTLGESETWKLEPPPGTKSGGWYLPASPNLTRI